MKIGLGTASFGTSISEQQAHRILDTFVESGGTIVDTANNYAFWAGHGGESESVIGQWLKTKNRAQVEIHTKIGAQPLDGTSFESAEGLSSVAIERAVEGCLKRLSTDYIDVLYAHIDDASTPLFESWTALSGLVDAGVVRQLGISNFPISRLTELLQIINANGLKPISYAQYRHTVIKPRADADLGVQICFDESLISTLRDNFPSIKLVAYSPLLDGAFEPNGGLPEVYNSEVNDRAVEMLRIEARCLNVSPSAVVLKKIADDGIMPLTMTGKIERLKSNMQLFIESSGASNQSL
jgi:aryl-alcohol dehydrogenase-like predicted oxidoreductase